MDQATKNRITACAVGFSLPRYAEIPDVGMYLDQAVRYVNHLFAGFAGPELTGSMVSNYVKKGLLARPVRKLYRRDHLAYLIFITATKTVLSLENIQTLIRMQKASYPSAKAYDYFCSEFEAVIAYAFGLRASMRSVPADSPDEKKLLRCAIVPAAHKFYLDCTFRAIRQEELGNAVAAMLE